MTRSTYRPIHRPALFGQALLLLLGACSSGSRPAAISAPPTAATPAADVDAILTLLDQGDAGTARKRLAAAMKRDPMNPSLQVLKASLERDPKELLGPNSYAYTVQPGETMTELAQRFLGNRLKSYQLARYNGIARPASLAAGQVIRIPGEPPRRPEPPRVAEPARPAPAPVKPRTAPAKPAVAAKPAAPAANPAAARQVRAAGLAALNQGRVVQAVGLLRRATALDPGNPQAARDLARAERIAATVRSHR